MKNPRINELMTATEAADALGKTKPTVFRYADRGTIKTVAAFGQILFYEASVHQFIYEASVRKI